MRNRFSFLLCAARLLCATLALPSAALAHQVVVANREAVPVMRFFLSAPDAPDWGGNLLDAPVPLGGRATVTWEGGCVADLRVVLPGAAEERRGVDLCSLGVLVIQPGWTTAPLEPGEGL